MRRQLLAAAVVVAAVAPAVGRERRKRWDSGDPTPAEQLVLERINRARADPAAEGTRLGIDIAEGMSLAPVPRPPLAMNPRLLGTARAHSRDMYVRRYFSPIAPGGLDPFERIKAAGYVHVVSGESIVAGFLATASDLHDVAMRDADNPFRGRRANALDARFQDQVLREVGVGYFSGAVQIGGSSDPGVVGKRDFLTEDFGLSATGPFALGVVYDDADGDDFYDEGEGLAGVTVSPDTGDWYAETRKAGGYAFPVAATGNVTITASGGPLVAPVQRAVLTTGVNSKVDFVVGHAPVAAVRALSLVLDFRAGRRDVLKLTARAAYARLPADLAGRQVTVRVGPVTRTLTLDRRGRAKSGDATVVVVRGRKGVPDTVVLVVVGDFTAATPFTSEGMDGAAHAKREPRNVAVECDLGNGPAAVVAQVTYTARAGLVGTAALAKR